MLREWPHILLNAGHGHRMAEQCDQSIFGGSESSGDVNHHNTRCVTNVQSLGQRGDDEAIESVGFGQGSRITQIEKQ